MPIQKDYKSMVMMLKHLKPALDEVVDYSISSDEVLCKECEELDTAVNEAREFLENWCPQMSKICSVSNSEQLICAQWIKYTLFNAFRWSSKNIGLHYLCVLFFP